MADNFASDAYLWFSVNDLQLFQKFHLYSKIMKENSTQRKNDNKLRYLF